MVYLVYQMVVVLKALSIRPYLRGFVFPWRCRKTILGSLQLMLRKKGSELACQMRELDISFHVGDGFALLSVGVTIRSAFTCREAPPAGPSRGARIILQRFGPPAFSPLCHCRICGMTRPHSSSISVVGGIRAGQKIGSSNQPDICFCRATRVGLSQARRRELWCVSSADYGFGYLDDETCRLEPAANPFEPKCYLWLRNET
jgi:hypothetical protein